jgi:protein TBF1
MKAATAAVSSEGGSTARFWGRTTHSINDDFFSGFKRSSGFCANMSTILEPVVKYESPYSNTSQHDSQAPPLKRRYSDIGNEARESDQKRQRVEVETLHMDDYDFDNIVAQAAASAVQSFAGPTNYVQADRSQLASQDQYASRTDNAHSPRHLAQFSSRFSSDPHLYMRILSLPILESLASLPC